MRPRRGTAASLAPKRPVFIRGFDRDVARFRTLNLNGILGIPSPSSGYSVVRDIN